MHLEACSSTLLVQLISQQCSVMTGLAVHVDIGRYCLQQSNRLIEIKTQAVNVVLILGQNDFHLLIKNFETPFNPSNWSLQHLTIKIIIHWSGVEERRIFAEAWSLEVNIHHFHKHFFKVNIYFIIYQIETKKLLYFCQCTKKCAYFVSLAAGGWIVLAYYMYMWTSQSVYAESTYLSPVWYILNNKFLFFLWIIL